MPAVGTFLKGRRSFQHRQHMDLLTARPAQGLVDTDRAVRIDDIVRLDRIDQSVVERAHQAV